MSELFVLPASALGWWNGVSEWHVRKGAHIVTGITGVRPVPGFGDPACPCFCCWSGTRRTWFQPDREGSLPVMPRATSFTRPYIAQDLHPSPTSVSREDGLILTDLYTAPSLPLRTAR